MAALPALSLLLPGMSAHASAWRPRSYDLPTLARLDAQGRLSAATLLIGDSVAQFWPPELLADTLGGPTANLGVSRDTTEDVLWRVEHLPVPAGVHHVVLQIGVNNLWRDDASKISADVERVVSALRLRCPGSDILVMAVLPLGDFLMTVRNKAFATDDLLKEVSSRHPDAASYQFVDDRQAVMTACSASRTCALFRDQLHPSRKGYVVLSQQIGQTLSHLRR